MILSASLAFALPCATPALFPLPPTRVPEHVARAGGDKLARDAGGPYANEVAGDNFIVKWGTDGKVSEQGAALLLAAFEDAWQVEIVEMDHPVPAGSDDYLFNVYIGSTGPGTPDDYGAGGYYWVDDDGHPMVVMSTAAVNDADRRKTTSAHEFYHAVQHAADSWGYSGNSDWYWEATATWMEGEVYPDVPTYAEFLPGFAFLPELGVEFFDYYDTGAFTEYHQYGAFIFPRFLTEFVGDWNLIRDSWVEAPGDSPLAALDALLQDEGTSLDEVFPVFAAHSANWDYADRDLYLQQFELWAYYYPDEDHRFANQLDGEGSTAWQDGDSYTLPNPYGYNIIKLDAPGEGAVHVEFQSDTNRDVDWGTTLVLATGESSEYVPFEGSLELEDAGDADALYLVIAPMTGGKAQGIAYQWRIWTGDGLLPEPPEGAGFDEDHEYAEEPGGCACSATARPTAWGLALALALALGAAQKSRQR